MMNYIVIGLVVLLASMGVYSSRLNVEIDMLTVELALSKSNEVSLSAAIENQNAEVSKYKVDLENKMVEYAQLLDKPAEIRYETVYKKIPSIKVQSDECRDIKKLLDDIRIAGY